MTFKRLAGMALWWTGAVIALPGYLINACGRAILQKTERR